MQAILARAVEFIVQSRRGIGLAVLNATLLFGLFEFAVSHWLLKLPISPILSCAVQATIAALGAGFSFWLILLGIADRRKMIEDEVRRVAELNHHLRNALEVIVLAHYTAADHEHKAMILDCTNRIDQKMRELFPVRSRVRRKNGKFEVSDGKR